MKEGKVVVYLRRKRIQQNNNNNSGFSFKHEKSSENITEHSK